MASSKFKGNGLRMVITWKKKNMLYILGLNSKNHVKSIFSFEGYRTTLKYVSEHKQHKRFPKK